MSFNLVDLVKDQLSDQVMGQVGNLLGDQSGMAKSGIASAIPALLNGFSKRAAVPGGADAMFNAVNSQDDGILDNLGGLLSGSNSKSMIDTGSSVLGSLFGNSGLGSLAGIISGVSGLSKGNTGSLLGLLAPIVMSVIKRKLMGSGGMSAGGLLDMFKSQGNNINAAMPQGLSDQLNSSGFLSSITNVAGDALGSAGNTVGNIADSATGAVGNIADSAGNAVGGAANTVTNAASGGSSIFKKLIPVIGLALLAWLGLKFFGGSADDLADQAKDAAATVESTATGAVSTATNAATDAASDLAGGVNIDELGSDLTGMFDSASSSLSGITDLDSAKAALPTLTEMGDKVSGLGGMIDKVPEAARGPLSGIISTGIGTLEPLIEKVSAIPGVGAVIEPILTPIMETLKGMAG